MLTLNSAAAAAACMTGGQGWRQAGEPGLALAPFMLVSKYSFSDVAVKGLIIAGPSRVAAQIASGAGYLAAAGEQASPVRNMA